MTVISGGSSVSRVRRSNAAAAAADVLLLQRRRDQLHADRTSRSLHTTTCLRDEHRHPIVRDHLCGTEFEVNRTRMRPSGPGWVRPAGGTSTIGRGTPTEIYRAPRPMRSDNGFVRNLCRAGRRRDEAQSNRIYRGRFRRRWIYKPFYPTATRTTRRGTPEDVSRCNSSITVAVDRINI